MTNLKNYNEHSHVYPIVWEDLFSPEEVNQIHNLSNSYEVDRAKTDMKKYDLDDSNIRRSDVIWIGYDENSKWLYEKVTRAVREINDETFGFELSGAQPFQYTMYDSVEEGEYSWHIDTSYCKDDDIRKLSVIILLSDTNDFSGGSFLVSPTGEKPKEILMKKGRMVVFPSWVPHCVTPVLEGKRVSLVMWMHGKKFK